MLNNSAKKLLRAMLDCHCADSYSMVVCRYSNWRDVMEAVKDIRPAFEVHQTDVDGLVRLIDDHEAVIILTWDTFRENLKTDGDDFLGPYLTFDEVMVVI